MQVYNPLPYNMHLLVFHESDFWSLSTYVLQSVHTSALQEVIGKRRPIRGSLAALLYILVQVILRRRRKDVEETLAVQANLQHAGHVTAPVAVIRRAPDGAQAVIVQDLEPLLAQLVGAEDVAHAVDGQEFLDHLRAECVACAAWRQGELVSFGVGIGPD